MSSVAILMCTKDGQRFLAEQLESIAAQSHGDWVLWVSDDGSRDDTPAILEAYRRKWGDARISVRPGPGRGYAENFLSLTRDPAIAADYYAYADQDDVWEADKLARACAWLDRQERGLPALYGSRTRLIDAAGRDIGLSPLIKRPPSFANALVQNIYGGNTTVFNSAARERLCAADFGVVAHDWRLYQVVTGCGGKVFYDSYPGVRYRQHGENLVGSNRGWMASAWRLGGLLEGRYRRWNDRNVEALQPMLTSLTPENRIILEGFSRARRRWLIPRLRGILASGVRRQSLLGNLGLMLAAVLNKV